MDCFLDEDVIEAYNNSEIAEMDIINLYDYGFISEELIDEFLEGGHLDETLLELSDYSSISEGATKRLLYKVGQYGSMAAGAAAGMVAGGPLGAAVAGKAAHDSYNGVTKFLKNRRAERMKRAENNQKEGKTEKPAANLPAPTSNNNKQILPVKK